MLTRASNRQPRCKTCDVKRKRPKKAVIVQPLTGSVTTLTGATPIQLPAPVSKKTRTHMPSPVDGEPAIKRIKRAKGGGIKGPPPQGARIISRKSQRNGKMYNQTLPTEIMRMISALYTRENRIKKAEDLVALVRTQITTAERIAKRNPTTRNQEMIGLLKSDLEYAERRLMSVKAWRDFTSQKVRLFLDHALSTTPYRTKKCEDCLKPQLTPCKTCGGHGTVRVLKTNHYALAAVARLKHLKKVLEVTELCAKVRAKTSEADAAYAKLLSDNMSIVKKFASENQTSMEHDDAEQGAMIGILDAAMRYNPVKPECYQCSACEATAKMPECPVCAGEGSLEDVTCKSCSGWGVKPKAGGMACPKCNNPKMMVKTSTADFKTYAYNWAYRNSRARKETDKRAGVYAPSLDAMMEGDDEGEGTQTVVADKGSKGSFFDGALPEDDTKYLVMDLQHQVSNLTGEQQAVINYTLAGLSLTEIAQALGVSRATVSKIRDQAHATLKKRMTGYVESIDDDE